MIHSYSSQLLVTLDGNTSQREGRLSQAVEKFTEARLFQAFFATGKLAGPAEVQPCNDDEYLGDSYILWLIEQIDWKTFIVCFDYNCSPF